VSFAAITLCVASQRVFIFIIVFVIGVYLVIDSVRKLLDKTSCVCVCVCVYIILIKPNVVAVIVTFLSQLHGLYGVEWEDNIKV
jgi:hypothetical protein